MRWSPSVTVAAVVRRGDRYLMVEESPQGRPVLNQPAGHLEADETLLDAVRREVLEETCHPFVPSGLVGIYQWTVPESGHAYLRVCFCGSVGEPVAGALRDRDITATHWLSHAEIVGGHLPLRSPLVGRCLDDSRARDPWSLDLLRALS